MRHVHLSIVTRFAAIHSAATTVVDHAAIWRSVRVLRCLLQQLRGKWRLHTGGMKHVPAPVVVMPPRQGDRLRAMRVIDVGRVTG